MRTIRTAALLIPLLALIAGCGNKGDLVKPTPPVQTETAPTPEQTAPDAGQH
ncbi:MAG: LPS translocon maturation chaperone LptM [Rhodanobacteraceae bacterium]